MNKSALFDLIEREGLLGLYRKGLFDPASGEYSYKKVGDQVTDVHRTEPTKTIMNNCKCGKPWTHEIWREGESAHLCCSCYVL